MVIPLLGAAIGADYLFNEGDATKSVGGAIGDAFSPQYSKYQDPGYSSTNEGAGHWGGQEGAAKGWMDTGLAGMGQSQDQSGWAFNEAKRNRGPQAFENQELSDREAEARGYHQAGALQLAQEAAMGMAPSEAAYVLQGGLDRSLAGQSALTGGARGGAGMALAQGNQGAVAANLQNQTFTEAGRLRAQEMAMARGQYGGLAGQQREQDLGRLGMGNDMSKFNAGLNDQYRLGMAGAANAAAGTANQWYGTGANIGFQAGQQGLQKEGMDRDLYNAQQDRAAGVKQADADARSRTYDRNIGLVGSVFNTGGNIGAAAASRGGGGTPPKPA